jgi:phage-related protein
MWVKVHFTIIKTVITFVLKAVWAVVKFAWKGISAVIRGAVKIISTVVRTYFNIVRTVITTVLKVIWAVVKAVWKGITTVIGGAVRGVVAVVRGAWNLLKSLTTAAFNGIKNIASGLWAKLVSTFSSGADNLVNFIKGLPGRIANLAASFINAGKDLGSSVINGIGDGLRAAGGFVSDLAGSVKDAINGALNLPFTIKGPGPLPDFTIPAFAKGTIAAPGGIARVGERGPENVFLPRGSKVDTAARTRAGDRNPDRPGVRRKVILRIGSRDFEAYVEEIADGRIDAADSLAFQGA